jgi:hypothetical protein
METIKGKVSNIDRDVEVTGPSYTDDSYTSGSTTDITKFLIAGRSVQFKSGRATYDSINEGDELIVAGKSRGTVFHITAYRNLTKDLNSYKGKGLPLFRLMGVVVLIIGIGFATLLLFLGNSLMPLLFALPFIAAGCFLFYYDYKYSDAIKSIENHR